VLLSGFVLFAFVVKMGITMAPLVMCEDYETRGEFLSPVGGSEARCRVEKVIMHNLDKYFSDAALKEGPPTQTVVCRGHCSVDGVGGEKGGHRFSAAVEKIGDKKMREFRWGIMPGEPDAQFIHIFIKEFGATRIRAFSDVKNSFIWSFAAGTDVFDLLVPLRQKSVDSATSRHMLGEPGAKLSGKSLKNTWHAVPVNQVKVFRVHKTFAVKRGLCSFIGVMIMEGSPRRCDKFLTVDIHAYVFKGKVASYIGRLSNGSHECIFGKCIAPTVQLLFK
jgi:hypothetical protein